MSFFGRLKVPLLLLDSLPFEGGDLRGGEIELISLSGVRDSPLMLMKYLSSKSVL